MVFWRTTMKVCSKCQKEKQDEDFPEGRSRAWCKSCHREYQKDWSARNAAHLREKSKERYLKNKEKMSAAAKKWTAQNPEKHKGSRLRKYWPGATGAEAIRNYQDLFEKQGGRCAVCDRPQSELPNALAVDHDHVTGKVRGLLCRRCNISVVGALDNYPDLFPKAILYIAQ